MNLIIWIYLGLAIWPKVFAIYYLEKKEIFQPPLNRHLRNNSYFGYSITYEEFNKKLVISAPGENDIGEVYNCSIENKNCTPIDKIHVVKRDSSNYIHDYWFGATVKAGSNFVTICAPRYTAKVFGQGPNGYIANGKCYLYNARGDLKELSQISNKDRYRYLPGYGFIEKAMDSFGWSIDVTSDNSIIVGGPGMHHEKAMDSFGWSIDVTSDNSIIVGGPGMHHGRAMIYEEIDRVPKLFQAGYSAPEFNFGYAIASGKFINNALSYAISSPYGTRGHGKVLFFKNKYFMRMSIEDTSHIGSMFGGVLCAAKLLGVRTDLLVGAPTYATKHTYDLGAVYVYLAGRLHNVPDIHRVIVGKESGSMFGSAIISVGDLNGDSKDEIAIGAPFEKDGHGVVYLYSGADIISNKIESEFKYLQRIEAELSYGESFGMSLAPLLDYDKNGCKELAIGSPYKDTVVLLRCMAAVIVETLKLKFPNLQIRNISQTDFEFEVCLSVTYPNLPQKIIAVLSTTVEIEHGYAKLPHTNGTSFFTYETSLIKKAPKFCKNVSLFLPKDGHYETKISYTISSKLLNDPVTMPDFNTSRVILSDLSVLTKHGSVWAAECTGNETCVPDLTLTPYISFLQYDDPYIIGTSKTETINMTVHNVGEVAYEPCVRVHIIGVNVFKTPTGCKHEDLTDQNRLLCEPSKPTRTNTTWIIGQIVLEMTHLTNLNRNITINMLLFDHCEAALTKNESKIIPVKADPCGISAKGETDIGSFVNMTKEDVEENGKKIHHIYTITNKGPTNWKNLEALVDLPKTSYIKYSDTPVTAYYSTSNVYSSCRLVSQNETSMSYVCLIESLVKNVEFAKIVIPINIVPGTLDGILETDKNVTIISSVKLTTIGDDSKVESIITTIALQEEMAVPIETIIIAVIVGVCITIIIVLILYWVGFLRRKKREELKKLKIHIKRQTVQRRSKMQSQAPKAVDRTKIMKNVQEKN